ncbi:N-acetyltransferase [Pantoea cypripedii]|uniref:N-acetyltransferase n=1 Tax=Pantoea cypripedii TaxID=55209 RepID=UPI002FC67D6C
MQCMQARDSDLDNICDLLTAEFFDDPIYKFVFINRVGRFDRMWRFFRVYVDLAREYGGIHFIENYAGVQVYFRPEFMAISNEHLDIDNRLRRACDSDYAAVAAWMKGCDNYHPRTQPHYYLFLTAVKREHRGHEGTRVLATLFSELNVILDKNGFPCYSECTRRGGQIISRRFGFRDAGSPRKVEGFPEFFPIWREPQQTIAFSEL